MQARIMQWKELAKDRQNVSESFDEMRKEQAIKSQLERRAVAIDGMLKQVPLRFRDVTFSDYRVDHDDQATVKRIAERFVDTIEDRLAEGASLVFMGKSGTGKTLLSLIIYQALAHRAYRVKYESSLEFIRNLIDIKFKSQPQYNNEMENLKSYPLLIIDEVTESVSKNAIPTDMEKQVLFHIINDRYENKLLTLVITNRDESSLIKRLGTPIMDRLSENGIFLAFNWQSYRNR